MRPTWTKQSPAASRIEGDQTGSMIERMSMPAAGGRGRLVRRIDKEHRQLALALERAQIGDRHSIVFGQSHFVSLSRGSPAGMTRQWMVDKAARRFSA